MKINLTSLALLGASLVLAQTSPAAVEYSVTQLSPDGTINNGANAIHANGFITGRSSDRAFLRAGGITTDLGLVPGFNTASSGFGVNASGQVAGYAWGAGGTVAARYSNGSWTSLGTLGGTTATAYGINDAGLIVGTSTLASGQSRGFLYKDGVMHPLAPIAGNTSYASAINASGQIAGTTTYTGSAATHAAIYNGTPGMGGAWTDIGSLGGSATARAINASGHVVGSSTLAMGMGSHAFLYANGTMKDLGSLPGAFDGSGEALGINDAGVVVGSCFMTGGSKHAFVYRNGTMRDLNNLIASSSGWLITEATGIDNSGRIVGEGVRNGETHAILLTPIAKPAAAPVLSVKGKKKIVTPKARYLLSGTTSGQVDEVLCKIGRRSVSAKGTAPWKAVLRLKPGKNVITVTASGPGGISSRKLVLVRQ